MEYEVRSTFAFRAMELKSELPEARVPAEGSYLDQGEMPRTEGSAVKERRKRIARDEGGGGCAGPEDLLVNPCPLSWLVRLKHQWATGSG